MKWMIASDLHGSAYYCQKMWQQFEKEGAERLLFLGDLLYHGPRNDLPKDYAPKQVIELCNEHKEKIMCVRGNCEAEVDQMVLQFPVMAEYAWLEIEGLTLFATHGHLFDQTLSLPKATICLQGHTHVPRKETIDDILYLNPGSLSIPKQDSPHSYMILDRGTFYWKDIEGNTYDTIKI